MTKVNGISVIIPSRDGDRNGNVRKLIEDLKSQTFPPTEIILVIGVNNASKSRNIGAELSKSDHICFIDDDITLGSNEILKKLKEYIEQDQGTFGLLGPSQLCPVNSNLIQKEVARTFPRAEQPIVHQLQESDMVTTACCIVSKKLFNQVGGFRENLIAAEDNDLRERIRDIDKKVMLIPNQFVFHPMPDSFKAIWKQNEWYGRGRVYVENKYNIRRKSFLLKTNLITRICVGTIRDVILFLFFKPLLFWGRLANRIGYLFEILEMYPEKPINNRSFSTIIYNISNGDINEKLYPYKIVRN